MHYPILKMRKQIVVYLLLAWLLLAVSQHHYSNKLIVQANGSVDFKVRTAQPSSRLHTEKVFPTWAEWKKIRKTPSGPNPVGNHHPPSRH